jgi:hypothetical protein
MLLPTETKGPWGASRVHDICRMARSAPYGRRASAANPTPPRTAPTAPHATVTQPIDRPSATVLMPRRRAPTPIKTAPQQDRRAAVRGLG